jgi:pSer/pThr/pTyr-binding forkhead associated (FHA) protein
MHKLVISDDEGKTTVVPLVRDEITIGRKEGNTIRLTERNVSRRHARIRKVNGGSFVVEDLGSYNGIKVNGRRIDKECPVKPGDQIAIGDYLLALQEETVAEVPESAVTVPNAMPAGAVAQADTAMLVAPPVAAPVALRPPARLVMISPPAPGAEYAFSRPRMRIGRSEELDIVVNHKSISREHAEVERIGDRIRIRDLGSANGTRVNGRDVSDHEIAPGDVIELGQVRFRFVGEGETYTLDLDRTVQVDALTVEPASSKAPLFIGGAIVAVALLGTVVFVAMSGGAGSEGVQATVTTVDSAGGAVASANFEGSDTAFAAALAACQSALAQRQFAQAQAHAGTALAIRAGDPTATRCAEAARDGLSDEAAFARAMQALGADRVEDAYFALGELRTDAFTARAEVAQVRERYARLMLERARTAANPEDAHRYASEVLVVPGAPPALQEEARRLVATTRRGVTGGAAGPGGGGASRGGGASVSVASVAGGGGASRGGGASALVASAAGGGSGGGGSAGGPTTGSARGGSPATVGAASAGGGGGGNGSALASEADRVAQARSLILSGDHRGAIRILEPGRSEQELVLLIATYAQVGDNAKRFQKMREFIERYPNTPRARSYQQVLLRQGQ